MCRKVAGAELAAKVTSTVVFPTQDARIIIYLYNKAGIMPAFLLYDFSLLTAKRVSQQRNEPQETINHLLCGWCNKCL